MGKLLKLIGWGREAATERLSLRMPKRAKEQLIALKVNTKAKSAAQLISWACSITEEMWEVTRSGGKIVAIDASGKKTTLVLPWQRTETNPES